MKWKQTISFLIFTCVFIVSAGCTTNGKNKQIIEVYILAGQSNAVGYNNTKTYNPVPFPSSLQNQPSILFWPGSNAIDSLKNKWTTLCVGASEVGKNAFGPEIALGHEIAANKKDTQIAIIKYAVGGTGIARSKDYNDYIPGLENFNDRGNNWYPPLKSEPAGKLYRNLLQNINNALLSLKDQNKKYRISGFIWMQGEHEAGLSKSMAEDYYFLLNAFITSLLNDLALADLPVVIGQISNKWIYGEQVKTAQQEVCTLNHNIALVTTHDLPRTPGDDAHYTANGMVVLGSRFAEAMLNIQSQQRIKK